MAEEALMNLAKRYAKAHIDACETWEHGGIDEVTTDAAGNVCVHYEDGIWFPLLRRTGRNCLVVKKSAHMSRQARALRKELNYILDGKEGFVKR